MERSVRDHEWDLVEQATPKIERPFGFLCGCGAGAMGTYASAKEACPWPR